LREIGQKGTNLQEMKEAINGVVAAIARAEMREFEFSTVKTRRVDIKKAMEAAVDAEIPLLKETMQVLTEYFYSQLLSFQRDDSVELSKTYRQKVKGKNTAKTPVEITSLVEDCHRTLEQLMTNQEPHWTKVSVAAALGTGRRMAEIHSLGSFEVAGRYSLHFTGQAKTRGAEDAKPITQSLLYFPLRLSKELLSIWESKDAGLTLKCKKAIAMLLIELMLWL
jgi:hypothetical protein